jgi:general secretion pathway protein M
MKMTMPLSDPHLRRRTLFVLGNLAVCIIVVAVVVVPICNLYVDRDKRIDQQRKTLARLTAITAQAANVQSIVADTTAQLQGGEFLSGSNENVISADLQTKLKAITESSGARSRAVQALPVKTVDQVKFSGSRIEIFGSLQSILRTIHAIESSKPYLFVNGAALRMPPTTRQAGTEEPVVQAQLDIFGAMQIGGPP